MDKREAARVPVQVRARCRSQDVIIDGLVEDVSRSGLFLRASTAGEPGTAGPRPGLDEGVAAELDLELPGEPAIRMPVEVVRIEEAGLGLRFAGRWAPSRSLANFMMRQHQASH